MSPASPTVVEVGGTELRLTNLDKELFPAAHFTKGDLIHYYLKVARPLLGQTRGRPLTLHRFPDGVEAASFYEKHVPRHAPAFVRTIEVPRSGRRPTEKIRYALLEDEATLVWAANLATIEFHVPMWRTRDGGVPSGPDLMVYDLDPGPGASIVECCEVALLLRARLAAEGLEAHAKTSGKKGLQLYARASGSTFEEVSDFAHRLADSLAGARGDLVVSNMRKELRRGRVLVDWSQNSFAKTTVAAYSVRAEPEPTVSTPVAFEEIERCHRRRDPAALRFVTADVLRRLERLGDLFAPLV